MPEHESIAKDIWFELTSGYSGGTAAAEVLWKGIALDWSSPGRHYHNLEHLAKLLGYWSKYERKMNNPRDAAMAIFYHDIVYVPGREDNEKRSAERAAGELGELGYDSIGISRVVSMIRATESHRPSGDRDTDLLLDMDMAVLAAPPDEYRRYKANLRMEYGGITDKAFRRGRIAFLGELLESGGIFITPEFHSIGEAAARMNIETELKELVPD